VREPGALYVAMTNKFSKPLNGAKLFTFTLATNTLAESQFSLSDPYDPGYVLWFYLKDFPNEK